MNFKRWTIVGIMLAFCVAGCSETTNVFISVVNSADTGISNAPAGAGDIVGTWSMVSESEEGSITFNNDGTFELVDGEETARGTYRVSDDFLQLVLDDYYTIIFVFSITGDTMMLTNEDDTNIFERV